MENDEHLGNSNHKSNKINFTNLFKYHQDINEGKTENNVVNKGKKFSTPREAVSHNDIVKRIYFFM